MKSDHQIFQERKAWARGRLLVAWMKLSRAVENPDLTREQLDEHEAELDEAKAIATEWELDLETVVQEAEAVQ